MKKKAAKNLNMIDNMCINTIRTLAMDAVQAAKSGHPGDNVASLENPNPS